MIESTFLTRVPHDDFFHTMTLIRSFLDEEDLIAIKLVNPAAGFTKAFDQYDDAFKQARKTGLIINKHEVDAERDKAFIGFYRITKGYLNAPEDNLREAATRIWNMIEHYGGSKISRMRQGAESAAITNLLQDLDEADLTVLNLKSWTKKLKEANDRFIDLHAKQTEKEAEYVVGLLSDTRKRLDEQFRILCKNINSLAVVDGEGPYVRLAGRINQAVSNAQQMVKQRDSMRKGKEELK